MNPGFLYLMPNTLDMGLDEAAASDLQLVLPLEVIRIAAGLTHWVAENAKVARAFLKRVDAVLPLVLPLQAIHIQELPRAPKGVAKGHAQPWAHTTSNLKTLLEPANQGHHIGLISDAGLPAVADPGAALVEAAHQSQIRVVPLVGPSSLLMALAASGLNGQSFAFNGYLPTDAGERASRIRELEAHSARHAQTQLFIETPYRNPVLLQALLQNLQASTRLCVACGLTLQIERIRSEPVSAWRRGGIDIPKDVPAVFALLADN
jgi:16S rRNA (cytidine1402-2'-O)-methyltransferase